jgi:hypothetical protein
VQVTEQDSAVVRPAVETLGQSAQAGSSVEHQGRDAGAVMHDGDAGGVDRRSEEGRSRSRGGSADAEKVELHDDPMPGT